MTLSINLNHTSTSQEIKLKKESPYYNAQLLERVDHLFEELTPLLLNINLQDLSVKPREKEYIDQLQFSDPRFIPKKEYGVNSRPLDPKLHQFLQRFLNIQSLPEKVLLAQRLFNAKYDNQEIRYGITYISLREIYPDLEKFLNFRSATFERILSREGIRFAITLLQSSGKLSSKAECILCENVDSLRNELQQIKNSKENALKLFLLQMGDTKTLEGDHTVPLLVIKDPFQGKIEVVITDAVGTRDHFLDLVARFVSSHLPDAEILGYAPPRHTNSHTCAMLGLNDAITICKDPKKFMDYIRLQKLIPINQAPYKVFYALPDEMMKFSQTKSALRGMLKGAQVSKPLLKKLKLKKVIIEKKTENLSDHPDVRAWKRQGLLITDVQLSELTATNVYANKLFAKFERKALESIFSPSLPIES